MFWIVENLFTKLFQQYRKLLQKRFVEFNESLVSFNMKTYFQIQNNRKMRVYQIIVNEKTEKRQQKTLGIVIADNSKIPKELFEQLNEDEQQELLDRMKMLREQAEYENARQEINKLPKMLEQTSALLASGRLSLTAEQRNLLHTGMNSFLKILRSKKSAELTTE